MADVLDSAEPGDRFHDYCLWEYTPVASVAGKLRSSTLLWHSFEALAAPRMLREMVEALRQALGNGRIVWGVKKFAERCVWELYFYDYARLQREVSIERVLSILQPFASSELRLSAARPYFMFSLDLDTELAERRVLDQVSVYLGNPGSTVSSGLSYQLTSAGLRFDNLYYFFDARAEWDAVVGKVAASAHLDLDRIVLDEILWPELRDCGVIVVANKKYNDGVYFSRIRVDQLIAFLDRLKYPEAIRSFVRNHKDRLDHMLYDVGVDYRMLDGRIEIIKSAYYGVV